MNAALALRPLRGLLEGFATEVPDIAVTGVELDSRRIAPGALFIAARGHSQHGLAHVAQALDRGAAAVAWEPTEGQAAPRLSVPAIPVESLGSRAGEIAARYWKHPSAELFTVGITGTDGKTSTAHLVAQALDRLGQPCAYFGTLGYGRLGALAEATHTTPDPVRLQALLAFQRDSGAAACAMEVSSHALDQRRIGGVDLDVAVMTNVGRDHLDYHGTVEHYAAAKLRLFTDYGARAAVLNRDDVLGMQWSASIAGRGDSHLVLYGLDGANPTAGDYVIGERLRLHSGGLRMDLRTSWGDSQLETRLLGRFNAYNLLAALSVLLLRGTTLEHAVQALSGSATVPGRIEGFRGEDDGPLVVVDYAHTPQALAQVLIALRAHAAGRLICVFGCGGDRDRGKRPLMAAAAAEKADVLIVTDDNPRGEAPAAIVADILAGLPEGTPVRVIHDRAEAIVTAVDEAGFRDVVLIAGKGHEDYQIYGRETRKFSDRDYVARLLGVEPRP
ncbi:MAG: UDP-N-acetylmuramoyl-L-alanyl-D-glutamate--2,6-diaminopimelate ligase [Nevskia sp.]